MPPPEAAASDPTSRDTADALVDAIMTAGSIDELDGRFAIFFASEPVQRYRDSTDKQERLALSTEIRGALAPVFEASGVFRHSLGKPFGYPGDFGILDHVYDLKRHPASVGAIGGLIDRWALGRPLPRAVSARKDVLKEYLRLLARTPGPAATVISLGCGAAREVCELAPEDRSALDITLLDSDPRGMAFAVNGLGNLNGSDDLTRVQADAVKGDLASTLDGRRYDLVYSFGVLDYLPGRHAAALIANCKTLMHEASSVLLCIKDRDRYDRWFYDLLFDWRFVGRSAADGAALMRDNGLVINRRFRVHEGTIVVYECGLA